MTYPQVYFDARHDLLSVKLVAGVEAKSYLKDGHLFSEDAEGRIIEIQILNLAQFCSQSEGPPGA